MSDLEEKEKILRTALENRARELGFPKESPQHTRYVEGSLKILLKGKS